jgi:hypothetical protein
VHSRSFQIGVEFRDLPQFGAGFKRPFVFLRVLCGSIWFSMINTASQP